MQCLYCNCQLICVKVALYWCPCCGRYFLNPNHVFDNEEGKELLSQWLQNIIEQYKKENDK
jgi:hypothetical protein